MEARTLRLLLVEDNPADARLVREYLKEAKGETFEVDVAASLSAALERLSQKEYAAALVDLSLPDSQGLPTLERLRAEAPRMPLLALTGLEDEDLALRAVYGGAQDYLTKRSLSAEYLIRSVRYAIGRFQMMRALELNALALQASEERYRNLVDGVDAIVWEADLERHRFTFVSHRVETLLGYPASDFLDSDDFWEQHVFPADLERELERRRASGAVDAHPVIEYRFKAADGHWVWIRDVVRVLQGGANGGAGLLTGVMIDVSELIAIQQYRDNLIDVISHEFRTPVTIIQGYAQLLTEGRGGALKPEAAATARERIRTASEHLSYLLGSITELSRLRSGGAPAHLESLSSRDLLQEAVSALAARGRKVSEVVQIHVARGAERIQGDRRKLVIALVELLDNALKFSPPGAPVWVEARVEGPDAILAVEDQGPGIPDMLRDSLFKPFVQADMTAVRATGGAGLGLAVVSGLVGAQGGHVELESVQGEGSSFQIVLPRAPPPRPPPLRPHSPK